MQTQNDLENFVNNDDVVCMHVLVDEFPKITNKRETIKKLKGIRNESYYLDCIDINEPT